MEAQSTVISHPFLPNMRIRQAIFGLAFARNFMSLRSAEISAASTTRRKCMSRGRTQIIPAKNRPQQSPTYGAGQPEAPV